MAYIEGMIGHFSLSPDEMTPWSKAKIESKLDITFPDRTKAMALKKLISRKFNVVMGNNVGKRRTFSRLVNIQ